MHLADATWPEVEATGRAHLLVIPVGSLEQHGPHLPLNTDTRIAVELAERACRARPDTVLAPAVPYGASGEHAAFPGTMVVRHEVVTELLLELVRSARTAFAGVVMVSAHGGNRQAVSEVADRSRADGDAVLVWSPTAAGGDAHAGRTETSLMLAIAPDAVRAALAEVGCTEPLEQILPRLRAEGVRPISSNGVLGDPAGASAAEGALLLNAMTSDLLRAVADRWPAGEPTS
jgi:creatinine amidohydrolase